MVDDPTPDQRRQASYAQTDWLRQAPATHWPGVSIQEHRDGCRTLVFHHLSEDDRKRILRAVRAARIPLPESLETSMHRQREIGRGGRKPGLSSHPDFLAVVVDKAMRWTADGNSPHAKDVADEIGLSYSQLNRALKPLTWSDIELVSSFGSLREALAHLRLLQRQRRQQRI